MDMGLVRKAIAFRVKYRTAPSTKRIRLSRLAVHPHHREGMYPQPDAVRNLGVQIMATGFNGSEADHEGVCVEEVPFRERSSANGRSSGLPDASYAEYNLLQCDHLFLEKCFSLINDIMYGT